MIKKFKIFEYYSSNSTEYNILKLFNIEYMNYYDTKDVVVSGT